MGDLWRKKAWDKAATLRNSYAHCPAVVVAGQAAPGSSCLSFSWSPRSWFRPQSIRIWRLAMSAASCRPSRKLAWACRRLWGTRIPNQFRGSWGAGEGSGSAVLVGPLRLRRAQRTTLSLVIQMRVCPFFLLTIIKPADDPPLFTCEKPRHWHLPFCLNMLKGQTDSSTPSSLSHKWLTEIRALSLWN